MDLLQVDGGKIVASSGKRVQLRGTFLGGWMNMENWMNGYPGTEHQLRETFARELGPGKAEFLFDRWLDHFFTEDDIVLMKASGATVLRIPLNYRHFESDAAPFQYLEKGFRRLDQALDGCARHEIYAILDLHAVQGYQNNRWHSDNATSHSLFWQHPHFQDRFVALWQTFARRYRDHPANAGYNVMNEPISGQSNSPGPFRSGRSSDRDLLNAVYRRVVSAIREIDADHIIYLDGDQLGSRFDGFDAPFAENLVYCSHHYLPPARGPGPYPGAFGGTYWDRAKILDFLRSSQGYQFTQKHNVPLWEAEFGAFFTGPREEEGDRLHAIDDQISVFEELGIHHWATVNYKDICLMGWVMVDPDCRYMQKIRDIFTAKQALHTDNWGTFRPNVATGALRRLSAVIQTRCTDPEPDSSASETALADRALSGYAAELLQTPFARRFQGMSDAEIDETMQSFRLENCVRNQGYIDVLKKHMQAGTAD